MVQVSKNYMAGVDKFGAAFAVGFMVLMLAFMGGLTPDGLPGMTDSTAPPPQRDLMEEQTQAMSSPPVVPSQPEPSSSPDVEDNLTGVLRYTISGGLVDYISPGEEENSIKIDLDTRLDGQLTIYITPNVMESFKDGSYFVTVDGEENHDFIQSQNKLTIDFFAGTEEIMIFGEQHDMHSMDHSEDSKEHEAMMAADKAAAEKAAAAAAKAPMSAEVEPVAGSAAPGCEPDCYDPASVTISAGGTVTFVNSDTAPHTVTSGSATDGPDGVWDSSLLMVNSSYSVTLDSPGNYPYFCMVHPWMEGTVIVE